MKSIYGKLILGFLASILFSFSIAGYFSLRKNSDELGRLTVEELNNSTELIADFLAMIDNDNLPKVLSGYASTSEVSFFIETQGHKEVYGTLSGRQLTTKEHQLLE